MNASITTQIQKHNNIIYSNRLSVDNSFIIGLISYRNQCPISAHISNCKVCTFETHDVFSNQPITLVDAKQAIEALLFHIKTHYPNITEVTFCDNYYVEVDYPLYLHGLYIVYNQKTWYELYFDAKMECPTEYAKYRERIETIFHNSQTKPTNYIDFLRINSTIFELRNDLEPYYKSTNTYSEFFNSIPLEKRSKLVYPYIYAFIRHYLDYNVFHFCSNWIMPVKQTVNKSIVDNCFPDNIFITHCCAHYSNIGIGMDDL